MAVTPKITLKGWFKRGKKPTQEQFADLIDSFFHKNESIPIAKVTNLQTALNNCASITQLDALAASISAAEIVNLGNRSTDYALAFEKRRFITVNFTSEVDITLDDTDAVLLNDVIIQGTGTSPVFSAAYEKISGAWVDESDVINFVTFKYISSSRVLYYITQQFSGAVSSIVHYGDNWRDIVIDGVMHRQRKDSGTWETYQTWGE